ncbi:MAG TPA: 3-deoxy-D-manno-octulosonic acid transferase [Saprospiraceae bacterium]|nr:3-deoxy-D-manno-octulosonic acid transferase [Saprospiraceae bacterium]
MAKSQKLIVSTMILLYNIAIRLYQFSIFLFSFFYEKAKLWRSGRKDIFKKIKQEIDVSKKTIWIHCSSLGEFEQGRPIIEQIKKDLPDVQILLTFFSPSGFEIRKNYQQADYIFYLPLDTKKNAQQFIQLLQPQLVVFVKYEFWYHYLNELKIKQIPIILVSAVFREQQVFFKWHGSLFRKMLSFFEVIFVQDENSKNLLTRHFQGKIIVAGDTRIDRVLAIAKKKKAFPLVNKFADGSKVLVIGSSWPPDEDILLKYINQNKDSNWKYIVAPHEIDTAHLEQIEKKLSIASIRFSQLNQSNYKENKVLIIDNIGMLSSLYQYGKLAYIGGGFGAGIHNILEPMAFHLPVIFGPKYQKFEEANKQIASGGGFCIHNFNDFQKTMQLLNNKNAYEKSSQAVQTYLEDEQGATDQIMKLITKIIEQEAKRSDR